METRMDPCLLWVRATIVGSVASFLGVAGHVTADGRLPGPVLLACLLALAVLLSVPLLSRPASRVRLLVLLVGGQAANHLVLSLTAGHVGERAATSSGAAPAATLPPGFGTLPVVDGHRVGSLQDAFTSTPAGGSAVAPALPIGHLVDDLSAHAPMMLAHLLAAAGVALWLARGEQYLWTVLALTGRRLVLVVLPPAPVLPPDPAQGSYARDCEPVGPLSVWLTRPDTRRGPPLLAA